jgi:hypothetical protein
MPRLRLQLAHQLSLGVFIRPLDVTADAPDVAKALHLCFRQQGEGEGEREGEGEEDLLCICEWWIIIKWCLVLCECKNFFAL